MAYRLITTTCNRRIDRAVLTCLKKNQTSIGLRVSFWRYKFLQLVISHFPQFISSCLV